ncbi:hypothetical protein B5P46_25680 [Rhizobium leguminosarum]|uniref:Transposase n=1 Tax=Rhizobium leguminosarum TaxID=384 RepID=A0A4Q1TMY5_RHILE|nr:hypothetical protein B5P46_25680 [Rhizobium leguminosarum]
MIRTDLPDRQWEKIAPHCHGKDTDPGRSGGNNRLFLEAVLWKARNQQSLARQPSVGKRRELLELQVLPASPMRRSTPTGASQRQRNACSMVWSASSRPWCAAGAVEQLSPDQGP